MSLPREFIDELKKHFNGEVRADTASRTLYSTDASIYQIEPLGVAFPKTQEDLHAAVELAAKYKIPILPRGSGTSLAGQAVGEALILDCSRWLDNIIEINPEEHYAIVEPGVVLSALNLASAKYGLTFGPDPASAERATMGGVIANNATGAHSIIYGMSADHLISADVIMADGSLGTLGERSTLDNSLVSSLHSSALEVREKYTDAITHHWPRSWRNSAGYRLNYLLPWSPSKPSQWHGEYPAVNPSHLNLAPLLAGSEGTLAVIRRAKVNLVPKPKHTILAVLSYQNIADACDDVPRLLTHHPSAIELIPQMILRAARSIPAYARQMGWVAGDPAALLVVEFSGDQPQALKACVELCRNDAARKVGDILTIAESKEDQVRIWNIRKVGLGLIDSRPGSARPIAFIEDCAIPVDRLGEFVREVETIMRVHGTTGGIYAHASGGCLHIRPVLDLHNSKGAWSLRSIAEATLALTLRLGGSMSSEHGDGIARGEWLQKTYGEEVIEAMRMLKRAADPDNLLNPNKLFDAPKMDSHLRYDEKSEIKAWTPSLDFSHSGNFVHAIELCNGQGLCRKDTGVMCPSFQATREEMHSTRGRANLLRALITQYAARTTYSVLRNDEMTESVARALDLCLACKGCKAECPSGVDMAKLKYEFENEYYKTHRRRLRDYIFGYFHITAALAASNAPLSNALMEVPVIRNLVAKILGITPHRPFPKFTKHVILSRGAAKNLSARLETLRSAQSDKPRVIFLSDPFSHYIEPQVEQAALDVLNQCGYDVYVLPVIGAGASLLSKGFIDAARRHARRLLNAVDQIDPAREAFIVGVEPPEIYTLKHDYLDLLPESREEIAQRVEKTWLLDEFLLRSEEFDALRVAALEKHFPSTTTSSSNLEFASLSLDACVSTSARNNKPKIYFHPHCHQRAEGPASDGIPSGTNATLELLRICGFEVDLMDTGCCGIAGSFGYEAEHYDLSMKIGELKLFPKLREITPTALAGTSPKSDMKRSLVNQFSPVVFGGPSGEGVVSTGAACRMQIQQGIGIQSEHSILLVRAALQ
ncbi:MAG: FAD-binding protein [Anaerolineae bacterium]|nr:FAD-binding protein [Anaerolineae bacterium]MCI0608103.1 FAD-binding protein [Anaerolineae bacterium]